VFAEFRLHRFGKRSAAVLAPFAVADDDDVVPAVQVLDAEVKAFEQAQAVGQGRKPLEESADISEPRMGERGAREGRD
jgi:hypothetical protein